MDRNMERRFEFEIQNGVDPGLLARVDEVFHGENLLQMILHAHLLVERGMTAQIEVKLARPELIGSWPFGKKLELYLALFNPPKGQVEMLKGLNRLRNKLAHEFHDEEKIVTECLPWETVLPAWAIGAAG